MSSSWSPMLIGKDSCLDALAAQLVEAGIQPVRRPFEEPDQIGLHATHVVMAAPRIGAATSSRLASALLTSFTDAVILGAQSLAAKHGPTPTSLVIVSTRDALGWAGRPWEAAYAGALAGAARSLALQFARYGLRVNLVCGPNSYESPNPAALVNQPVTPADVATGVWYFLDPENTYVTGQTLYVTGGSHLLSSVSA